MTTRKTGSEHEDTEPGAERAPGSRRSDPSRLTPQLLVAAPDPNAPSGGEGRIGLVWQLWLDGEIRRTPLPLANGLLIVLDRPGGSLAIRLDPEGRELWQVELGGVASADPVRTQTFVAVPIGGERVVVIDVVLGRLLRTGVAVQGAAVRGGIAALGGRLWVRLGKTDDGMGPFLAVLDLNAGDNLRLVPDPLGVAIETRCRRTNNTVVAAAEDPNGSGIIVGLDEVSARVLWSHELRDTGVVDLWAAGGLVDLVVTNGLRSWDARSGVPLTRRFEGRALEGARLAGETLLVPVPDNGAGRRLLAFDACTEEGSGALPGVHRIICASSDVVLVRDGEGLAMFAELPSLTRYRLAESDAIEGAELVAFSRHALWVVAHGGRSLTCLEPPSS